MSTLAAIESTLNIPPFSLPVLVLVVNLPGEMGLLTYPSLAHRQAIYVSTQLI